MQPATHSLSSVVSIAPPFEPRAPTLSTGTSDQAVTSRACRAQTVYPGETTEESGAAWRGDRRGSRRMGTRMGATQQQLAGQH